MSQLCEESCRQGPETATLGGTQRQVGGGGATLEPDPELTLWTPRARPWAKLHDGVFVRLEPVDPTSHADGLYEASHNEGDPDLWNYLFVGPFPERRDFQSYLERMPGSADPLWFTVVEKSSCRPSGIISYLRIVPEDGVIEIGHIWFAPHLQRTAAATEVTYLLARHVFEDLGYRRLEWKCDARNARSRRAAERLGFSFEGIFRQHHVTKGRNRDTAWYSMLDREWPVAATAFREWLAPGNFDTSGRQRRTLTEMRAAVAARS